MEKGQSISRLHTVNKTQLAPVIANPSFKKGKTRRRDGYIKIVLYLSLYGNSNLLTDK